MLSILVPCYNEEDSIAIFLASLEKILKKINYDYEIIFINDGSIDNTFNVILNLKNQYKNIRILNLSRNFGKEAALSAGIDKCVGDMVIPMDIDLQDPPELIFDFIKKYEEGYDVILAKRINRKNDSFFKRLTSYLFYKLIKSISNTPIHDNVGDYRLISKKVVESIKKLPENQRFMKGLFAWVGYKTTTIEYVRPKRVKGNSRFNVLKLWNLSLDGITGFSTIFLKIWLYMGILILFFSFILGIFIMLKTMVYNIKLPTHIYIVFFISLLEGLHFIGIGIIGEYISRIHSESKRRPIYIIEGEY